jgi:predicted Zn-dependent protease
MTRWQRSRKRFYAQPWKRLPICYLFFVLSSIQLSAQSALTIEIDLLTRLAADQESTSSEHAPSVGATASGTADAAQDGVSSFCLPLAPPRNQPIVRKQQAEWEIGNKLAAEIEQQETIIHDPDISAYLNRLERSIASNSHLEGCFSVQIIEDLEANAYSLPGGFLYLTSGLILVAQSEGELTAALAHETAHVTAHHFMRIERKRRMWGRLALAGGPAGYFVRRFIGPILTRKLIRNSEFEADRLSLRYQSGSGYDPTELSQLLRGAFQDESKRASFVQRLFDTHPLITTRIRRLDNASESASPATADYIVDTGDFHELKERLSRLLKLVIIPATASKTP